MPFLVVLGTGSWSAPGVSKVTFKAAVCKQTGKGYKVDEAVAEAARATGYWWLAVFPDDDEPILDVSDPTGPLEPEDIRVGVESGVRFQVIEGDAEPEPDYEDPDVPAIHSCTWCIKKWPSSSALARHVEFEHTKKHEADVAASIEQYESRQVFRKELRRLEDTEEPLPPWEREAVDVGLPPVVPEVE